MVFLETLRSTMLKMRKKKLIYFFSLLYKICTFRQFLKWETIFLGVLNLTFNFSLKKYNNPEPTLQLEPDLKPNSDPELGSLKKTIFGP